MQIIKIYNKKQAAQIHGGLTHTTKMPCASYSLPTLACKTGFELAKIPGTICNDCYANKGNYKMYQNNIEPAQIARLFSIDAPEWIQAMIDSIGNDQYFRWHDSGDLQGLSHLQKIITVCNGTPITKHWLPTREYSTVAAYVKAGGIIPDNLIIRLSAMYPDRPVKAPVSLQGIKGIALSNVHSKAAPIGKACKAPEQNGECRDCRECWAGSTVSYKIH